MPLTCVPTVTLVTGSMVPVAVIDVWMFPFSTFAIENDVRCSFLQLLSTAMTVRAISPMLIIFLISVVFYCFPL